VVVDKIIKEGKMTEKRKFKVLIVAMMTDTFCFLWRALLGAIIAEKRIEGSVEIKSLSDEISPEAKWDLIILELYPGLEAQVNVLVKDHPEYIARMFIPAPKSVIDRMIEEGFDPAIARAAYCDAVGEPERMCEIVEQMLFASDVVPN